MTIKYIEKEKQGCHTKSQSWFNDERVQLAIHKFISFSGDKFLAQKLAKVIKDYLSAHIVTNIVQAILKTESTSKKKNTKYLHSIFFD